MWDHIRPETVAKYIRFKRDEKDWHYDPKIGDMYAKQAEGAAFLWNCLGKYDIALLADEVGMGKTLQALSVIALLFHQKPDARILIIAPRSVVAENWISEYQTFIAQHYKKEVNTSNIICTEIGGEPIHPANHCANLEILSTLYKKCWPHLFIIRTSSLSNLVKEPDDQKGDEASGEDVNQKTKQEKAFGKAKKIREDLYKAKSECYSTESDKSEEPFDLLVIDEAHYFRTKYGGSQKVGAAQAFFGAAKLYEEEASKKKINWRPIATKTLLLTATPNHSTEKDIENIFSYFPHRLDLPSENKSQKILNDATLRRFRRFEKKTKYNYREEATLRASFAEPKDTTSEIFFALYQKRLAHFSEYEKKHFLHGYLEGFEAIPEDREKENSGDNQEADRVAISDENQTDPGETKTTTDYRRSEYDSEILENLLRKFQEAHGEKKELRHPKYDILVKDVYKKTLENEGDIEKAVVFVRRIPSTKEISRRINSEYDTFFCARLAQAYGVRLAKKSSFHERLQGINDKAKVHPLNNMKEEDPEGISEGENEDTERESKYFQRSVVLEMFKIKKKAIQDSDVYSYAHLFNQIQAFRKKCVNRKSLFSLMFHPPSDYVSNPYKFNSTNIIEKNGDIDYEGSAFLVRKNTDVAKKMNAKVFLLDSLWSIGESIGDNDSEPGRRKSIYKKDLETLLTVFLRAAAHKNEFTDIEKRIKEYSVIQIEALCRFLRQGLLNASGFVVEFFVHYVKAVNSFQDKNLNLIQVQIYRRFLSFLKEEMKQPNNALYSSIRQSIELFPVIQTKEMAIHNEEDLLNVSYWRWNIFNNQSPAYGFSGVDYTDFRRHAYLK